MTPMITRDAPRLILRLKPEFANARDDPLDLFFGGVRLRDDDHITLSRDHENDVGRNFLQAQIQRRTKPDVSIMSRLITRNIARDLSPLPSKGRGGR